MMSNFSTAMPLVASSAIPAWLFPLWCMLDPERHGLHYNQQPCTSYYFVLNHTVDPWHTYTQKETDKFTAILSTTGSGLHQGTHSRLIKRPRLSTKEPRYGYNRRVKERVSDRHRQRMRMQLWSGLSEGVSRGPCRGIPERSSDWLAIRLGADWLGTMLTPLAFIRRSGEGRGRLKVWQTGRCTRDCGLGRRFNRTNGYEWFNGHYKGEAGSLNHFMNGNGFWVPVHMNNERWTMKGDNRWRKKWMNEKMKREKEDGERKEW